MEPKPNADQIKSFITEVIAKEKPENAEQLNQMVLKKYSIPPDTTTIMLIEMEKEGKIHLLNPKLTRPISTRAFFFSQKSFWYWIIITLAVTSTISVFVIPETAFPAIYLRNGLSLVFLLFLPGYAIMKALFPSILPIKMRNNDLDNIERIALSLGTSIVLVAILGLLINSTPLDLQIALMTLSILALTVTTATVAVFRDYQISTATKNGN